MADEKPKEQTERQTPDSLRAIAKELERFAMGLRMTADDMEAAGIDQMKVNNYKSINLGFVRVHAFTSAAERSRQKALKDRGKFHA